MNEQAARAGILLSKIPDLADRMWNLYERLCSRVEDSSSCKNLHQYVATMTELLHRAGCLKETAIVVIQAMTDRSPDPQMLDTDLLDLEGHILLGEELLSKETERG